MDEIESNWKDDSAHFWGIFHRESSEGELGLLKMFSENQFLKSPPTIKLPTVLECFCFVSLVCFSTSTLR